MTYEEASELVDQIGKNKSAPAGKALVLAAIDYARVRVDHLLASPDTKQKLDSRRTELHDAFIAACDEVGKQMSNAGQDTSWRTALTQDRKIIGDFACYIHCIAGIWAR